MTALTSNNQQQTSNGPSYRLYIAVSFMAFILIGANDGAVGVLIPTLQIHYQLDKGVVALLFLFSVAGYLTAAFNTGLLVARLGEKRFLLSGLALFMIGAVIISTAPPFAFLLGAMTLLGFGSGVIDAGFNAFIARLPRSTALLNYLHAFYGIGALLGPLVASGYLALTLPWNSVYMTWVGLSALTLIGLSLIFRAGIAPTATPEAAEAATSGNIFTTTLRLRMVWFSALFLLSYVGTEVSLGTWSYSFLTEERHGNPLFMGWVVSGYWLGLTVGRLTLAQLALRIGEKRLIQLCLVGVVIGVLLVWLVPGTLVPALGLCLTGFSLGPIFPTTIALMPKLVPQQQLPSAVGFVASLGSMGAALFPWVAGNLAKLIGLWALLPYVIVLTIFMLIFWLILQASRSSQAIILVAPVNVDSIPSSQIEE